MKKRDLYIAIFLLTMIGYAACQRGSEGSKKASEKIKRFTTARFETDPMSQATDEDAADDPVIWVNWQNPDDSKIIGTDKKGGLAIYNLEGEQLFYYPDGNMNNVDLRYGFVLGNDTVDLVCASNRSSQSISVYKINQDGSLENIAGDPMQSAMQDEVYGFCMYQSPVSGKYYAFVNSKAGEVEQWELLAVDGKMEGSRVRTFSLGTQVEGMVADDENQTLFIGEEVAGIWKFDAEPDGSTDGTKLAMSTEEENENIRYDLEGLALYYLPEGEGYLVASSQGNYSYAVFNRQSPHVYLGSFRIDGGVVDGAEETDGLEICSFPLNDDFQHGLLVVQDGFNKDKKGKDEPQNFKLVAWEDVASLFQSALKMN
ncbi:phytase [Gaoshiqia sediminis]|uniref:Phytase n=1 Tax=Gaoshiqia sediminis TaxID=2986998 RepID=A0AA41YCI2_9BACT|nr:phytase [Gaoshiqia sediminis]MCW0483953.1 phytase [Gaoshiqia sediminis]